MREQLDPKPGQWVLIRAEVVDERVPPECIAVQLFNKNGPYPTEIRRTDVLEIVEKPIPDEPAETTVVVVGKYAYQRLTDHWYRVGRPEMFSWADLCRMGTPEVVAVP